MRQRRWLAWTCLASSLLLTAQAAWAVEAVRQIPDEYETTSGHDVGLNDAGYAANDGFSAIRANPALLARSKQYTVSAGYNWPTQGRDFYQAGIVDSKTSPLAAGVSYTGFTDNYVYSRSGNEASPFDSPVIRRGVLGLAEAFGSLSLGIGGTYVEAHSLSPDAERYGKDETVKGTGLNVGVAGSMSPQLSLGASVENASNEKIKDYAPRTYRAGAAYSFNKQATIFLDFRQRERIAAFEAPPLDLDNPAAKSSILDEPERMVIGSFIAQVQNFLRVMASYGQSITDQRRSLAGGLAVVNKNFSLSYTASRPYMSQSGSHQAVTLSLEMAM